jgi:hypothetical protein
MLPARFFFNLLHNAWQRLHTMSSEPVSAKCWSIVLQVFILEARPPAGTG